MKALVLTLTLIACTPATQLEQMCLAQYDRCAFGQYDQLARYRRGVIEIDERLCDENWPLCEFAIYHELGHANGNASEHDADCYAWNHSSEPARREASRYLGELQCAN
jgi:hypothetical protein